MSERVVYLDSSAIVKRYVLEPGSRDVRELYLRAYSGEVGLAFSVWNVGEVLGVFDKAVRLGRLGLEEYRLARNRFLLETRRMVKLGVALVLPVKFGFLKESWRLVERYHVYQADALQLVSARHSGAEEFVTGDKRLHELALDYGLNSVCVG